MVDVHDPLTEELQRCHLRLNDEIIFSPQKYGNEVFVHVEIPSTSRFFRIGYAEYVFVSQFDGLTSSATAMAITAQSQGADAIDEKRAEEVIDWMLENGIAGFDDTESGVDATDLDKHKKPLLSRINPFWLKLPLGNPDAFLQTLLPFLRWAFHPLTVLVSLIFILAAILTSLSHWNELFGGYQVFASYNWAWMLLSWVVLKTLHELAHGVTCRYFGGRVKETGLIFILFAPLAYMDVTSSWRFTNRWKRIAIACAGIYLELMIASACVFLLFQTDSAILRNLLVNTIVMSGVTTLLFNANPLMRFDGYFVLSDLLKIPNLYENGAKIFRQNISWIFLGQATDSGCYEIENRRWVIQVYGWLASIWKVTICFGMTIAASTMLGGFGILLAGLGVVSWFGKPTVEMSKRLMIHFKRRPHSMVRSALLSGLIVLLMVSSWFWIPSPFAVRVPCLVEYQDAAKVRLEAGGFVDDVFVTDGAIVKTGQPLLLIRNDELVAEVQELQSQLLFEETRERIAMDKGETAEAQIAARQQKAILTTLSSRSKQLDELVVKAPCDGRVVAQKLSWLKGRYLEQGEVALLISQENAKEVLLSIPVTEIHVAKELKGETVPIEIGSRKKLYATIDRINPRASIQVSHASLADPNGGPIPVRQGEQDSKSNESPDFEYLEPRLNVVANLDSDIGEKLYSGERGYAVLNSPNSTLGKSLYVAFRDWLARQIELADPSQS